MSIVPKRLDGSRCPWYGGRPWPRAHCARWGPSCPPQKRVQRPPNFGPCLLCPKGRMDQHALGMELGLGPGHIVLDGNLLPFPEKGAQPPPFSAHVCCGQTAGWIKMPLGTKIGLGPGHIVLHGDPAPSPIRSRAPKIFGPCLLWPNGRQSQLLLSICPLAYENVHTSGLSRATVVRALFMGHMYGPLVRIVNHGISESQHVYLRTRYYNFVVVLCDGRVESTPKPPDYRATPLSHWKQQMPEYDSNSLA